MIAMDHVSNDGYLILSTPFMEFLEFSDISDISNVSVYWKSDRGFMETRSATNKLKKSDLIGLLRSLDGELVSIRFNCLGDIEIDSDGKSEIFISRNQDFKPLENDLEHYKDALVSDAGLKEIGMGLWNLEAGYSLFKSKRLE